MIYCKLQARKRWNTRPDNGTKNASVVASAKLQSEQNRSSHANKISIVLAAMKSNLPLVV
jgi:hypothetical protein